MATHIDVLCGDYAAVVIRNIAAIKVDRVYKNYTRGEANFYLNYRIHNLHFCIYGAMLLGARKAGIFLQ